MITWTAEQREFRDLMVPLADELNEGHIEWDEKEEFPYDKWKTIQRSGLLAVPFREEWGGRGQSLPTTMYALEGLGYHSRDAGLNFSASTQIVSTGIPLQRFGSKALKDRYLPRILDGSLIGAHAITEPDHGSDATNIQSVAVKDGDDYVINGSKMFISNATIADVFLLYVRTGEAGSPLGISVFLVERDTPGLSVGPNIRKMGLHSSPLAEVFFDELRVPASNMLGSEGAGFLILDYVMKREILFSFSINLGEMQHRLERVVAYARSREQFGRPIGKFQGVSHKIADMKIAVETARKWLYDTAEKVVANKDSTIDVAATKITVSEANKATALTALQIFGGYGYLTEHGIEKDVRNALAGTIYSGTSEIQRNRIASMLGL
ncbi:acyl-CoA dehydrogenase [Streptomyces agglomeratus]|uniref:Acyl-CoA dehydrogenase n=1 Tax=Streptomyces agglomeratus TaxID=285458 RepID=A0A1E5P799_9ACTN|nr:acyl-CoA dehydrogenase family protein [Streptomyces agglomeratus]OEJ25412.1 acyl-CoA dehydrogenase [Streptomyces agglomeratus]OEJ40550.1 acyl-CoA dehydrogenase [Streptomyces agglomeratus]OEJ45070.1 acyl-CoA dehydrogenase [Streptomyces agglomeratus]OEJ53101.1 acyl-CoA dehydrogenase [Streptomyces agglomeratus]OEJ60437.1 acyl-CoA dehydrogenase [Streptomyces agglomeratus]